MALSITDFTFISCKSETPTSSVFYVSRQGQPFILKVYHTVENQLTDPFTCESTAYTRLKDHGLCQQGLIPNFHGVIEHIDPLAWQPHLNAFLHDNFRPNAVLLEYVPNMKELDLWTYTPDRAAVFLSTLRKIHDAGVCHLDPYPRNLMVQEDMGRVLWIDFDRARTGVQKSPMAMEIETAKVECLLSRLAKDVKTGRLVRAYLHHIPGTRR